MNPTAATDALQLIDAAEVRRTLQLLLSPGQVTELRILDGKMRFDRWATALTGYFDNADALVAELGNLEAAKACYIIPNPVNPALLARAANRIKRAGKGETTSDNDIVSRHWLPVDCDPQRPSGISATDSEHEAALARCDAIRDHLHFNCGWPEPIVADSGNGGHLMYLVELPADDGALIQRCLAALNAEFSDNTVHVDTGVFNPARIWKLYGTLSCKGDSTADRPHRISRIISAPSTLHPVARELLEALASEAPATATHHANNGHRSQNAVNGGPIFDIDAFIAEHGLQVTEPTAYQGGRRWTFTQSPLCDHHDGAAFLIQFGNGALSASCHHNSCSWKWQDLREKFAPKSDDGLYERLLANASRNKGGAETAASPLFQPLPPIEKFTFAELQRQYPKLNPPVVDGLFRAGETANVVSVTKVGKSWLVYNLALSIITGRQWLGQFPTSPGKVVLVDNELHRGTLSNRIPAVAGAMGISAAEYQQDLKIWPLRGNLRALTDLAGDFQALSDVKAVILDAKYRFAVPGKSENDNAAETLLYNLLDQFAAMTGAAFVLVHHSTKGGQSEKRVTDVGAGGGAQSRATDCHLVLREHEEEGIFVLDAAVRSFAPVEPLALDWDFPMWRPAHDVDTSKLKGRKPQQAQEDQADMTKILAALEDGPACESELRPKTGLKRYRQSSLLDQLAAAGKVCFRNTTNRGNKTREFYLPK